MIIVIAVFCCFLSEKSETKSILYHYLMPFPLDAVLSRESINMSTNKQRNTKEEEEEEEEEDFDYCLLLLFSLPSRQCNRQKH